MTPEQCKAARSMAGLSQQALADAAKVAKATVATFEQGKRKPYDRTLADMQAALEACGVQFTPDGVNKMRAS
jgi:transcriptional regulator with XRE-family HTH domain